jgi:hypothetical protein
LKTHSLPLSLRKKGYCGTLSLAKRRGGGDEFQF